MPPPVPPYVREGRLPTSAEVMKYMDLSGLSLPYFKPPPPRKEEDEPPAWWRPYIPQRGPQTSYELMMQRNKELAEERERERQAKEAREAAAAPPPKDDDDDPLPPPPPRPLPSNYYMAQGGVQDDDDEDEYEDEWAGPGWERSVEAIDRRRTWRWSATRRRGDARTAERGFQRAAICGVRPVRSLAARRSASSASA